MILDRYIISIIIEDPYISVLMYTYQDRANIFISQYLILWNLRYYITAFSGILYRLNLSENNTFYFHYNKKVVNWFYIIFEIDIPRTAAYSYVRHMERNI